MDKAIRGGGKIIAFLGSIAKWGGNTMKYASLAIHGGRHDNTEINKEYVEAYMLNEHYRINPDTVKNIVMDNYNYMMKVGGIENPDKSVNMEDRIYNKLYKEALDEAVEKWGDEDKDFYDNAVKFYQENNE